MNLLAELGRSSPVEPGAPGLDNLGHFFYSVDGAGKSARRLKKARNPLVQMCRPHLHGTFSQLWYRMSVGIDKPAFGENCSNQNLLERACCHRLVLARCWPVKPKSSLGGFSFGSPTAERRYRRLGPATLHGPVLMSEHSNETGCAKRREPARVGLNLGTNENRLMTKCRVGVDRPWLQFDRNRCLIVEQIAPGSGGIPGSGRLTLLPLSWVGTVNGSLYGEG